MAKYIEGDKVITTDEWNNGIDRTIPKGSIVRIISIAGKIEGAQYYNCIYQGEFALYEEGWLGEKINTNADRIRSMSDEELLDFICSIETYDDGSVKIIEGGSALCSVTDVENWLKSEAENEVG